jgi:hypothetical protein
MIRKPAAAIYSCRDWGISNIGSTALAKLGPVSQLS